MANTLLNIQVDTLIEKTVATLVILPSYFIVMEDDFADIFFKFFKCYQSQKFMLKANNVITERT